MIALIIPIFHCGACQRASDGEVPRGSLRSKILWGEGAAAERAMHGSRKRLSQKVINLALTLGFVSFS